MSDTVHTAILLALISGILMAGIGVISAKRCAASYGNAGQCHCTVNPLHADLFSGDAVFYALIIMGAAILRAVGDTKRPLLFLVISGCANALLDLILVIGFHLGVAGVATATITAQMISLHSGFVMPVPHRQLLSAALFEAENKKGLSAADFSGGNSCRDSKYGY